MPRPSCTPALDTTNLPQNRPQAVGKVPNKSGEPHTPKGEDFHVGPHIMIVSPHEYQKELESFSHDGSNGIPDVAHLTNGNDSTNANSATEPRPMVRDQIQPRACFLQQEKRLP